MREPHPLAVIQDAVLEFLRGRDDAVLYGAQAVNAYVKESRMTQDVDIATTRALELAGELRKYLNQKFHIAVRVRKVREGLGYRIYQVRKPENRHERFDSARVSATTPQLAPVETASRMKG